MPLIYGLDANGNQVALRVNESGGLEVSGSTGGGGGSGITQSQVQAAIEAAEPVAVSGPMTDAQLRAAPVVTTSFSTAEIGSVSTSGTGADFVTLADGACRAVDLANLTDAAIEYRRNGAGVAMGIPAGATRLLIGITNSNQISVRRVDLGNASVNLSFERLS